MEARRANVLIVDSSGHIRRLVATLMAALGAADCAEARNVAQAVAQTIKHQPDLIILGLGSDATEALLFVHRLRRAEFGVATTPVLGISASTHHTMLEMAWEAGIDEVVGKPISAIDLMQRAGALLASSDGRRPAQHIPSRSAAE
ncbi:MAG: response regulator [Magnetospirillum sp.]|nr:response regulator [Magnetospirillum sp.]